MTVVGVCGFARSGTSMLMRMLDAGGVHPIDGSSPAGYEIDHLERRTPDEDWWWERYRPRDFDRRAVKLLDSILRTPLPTFEPGTILTTGQGPLAADEFTFLNWRFVWIDREPREVAASQAKFLTALAPDLIATMGVPDRMAMQRSLRRDRTTALAKLRSAAPTLVVSYERILANPHGACATIAEFLEPWWSFDIIEAAAVPVDRSPVCAPDLSMEADLIAERRAS